MRKYPAKSRARVYAAIFFGILILACLVSYPMSLYYWRASVRSEAQYNSAPLCTTPEQSGCRRQIESAVKGKHTISAPSKTTHYMSLLMPGSSVSRDIPVWWEADHSLYGSLEPGDRVTAQEWEGQIVAIKGANNGTLRTEYDPAYTREGFVTALVAVPLVTVLMIILEYKVIRAIRIERIARN